MERDEFCCTVCQDGESTLNVHHHYYTKGADPWEYDDKALTTLCEDCHKHIEGRKLDLLKSITWEVPFESICSLATGLNPWDLADLDMVFVDRTDLSEKTMKIRTAHRIECARRLIDQIQGIINKLSDEN